MRYLIIFLLLGVLGVGIFFIYQNRMKVMRFIISVDILRKISTRIFMKLPGVREKFLASTLSRSAT
ncbi:hypothetical protein GWK91_07275 [Virgibacillus sp. MSP4-1]|uniref:hypothetical protein n=1 Tax=Virgibacillus sp. MSP4-1 TaxID=2700081 RepID=UPI0003A85FD2|nr:hypothetical protein [Virgibacillus sp. MSP4-1]QHS22761.1 hypothetical protein GWK91_07275 [Virgibacillus sp. MSP4-1]